MPEKSKIESLAGAKPVNSKARFSVRIGGSNNNGEPCALVIDELQEDGSTEEWYSAGAMTYNNCGLDTVTLVQQIMSKAVQNLIDVGAQRIENSAGGNPRGL